VTLAGLPVDGGLLARFRGAGRAIAWRPTSSRARMRKGHRARIAHLHDEEARVESWGNERNGAVEVDSGPLGALVLLLEIDRRGPPSGLGGRESGRESGFSSGSIVAAWGKAAVPEDTKPRLADLVELARYALT
jgi:hypothetical protein